jgi:hypothetical protein
VLHHFTIWQQQTHPAVLQGSKKSCMHMKVPSTTTLSFPTLSPLLIVGKNSQILFGQTMYLMLDIIIPTNNANICSIAHLWPLYYEFSFTSKTICWKSRNIRLSHFPIFHNHFILYAHKGAASLTSYSLILKIEALCSSETLVNFTECPMPHHRS